VQLSRGVNFIEESLPPPSHSYACSCKVPTILVKSFLYGKINYQIKAL